MESETKCNKVVGTPSAFRRALAQPTAAQAGLGLYRECMGIQQVTQHVNDYFSFRRLRFRGGMQDVR